MNKKLGMLLILGLIFTAHNVESAVFTFKVNTYEVNRNTNRINIGYAGDGLIAADTAKFTTYMDSAIKYSKGLTAIANNARAMRPLPRYNKFFNWYVIPIISVQSGCSATPGWGIPDTFVVNTALKGTHDRDRLGWTDDVLANGLYDTVAKVVGKAMDWKYTVLNINGYYNSGGTYTTFAYPNWGDIAIHEAGHSLYSLADEYWSCDASTDNTEYPEINSTHTINSTKWLVWKGYVDIDPLIAIRVGGCGGTGSTVDYYLGSRYVQNGQYRPTNNSKMGWTSQSNPVSFNAPCREKIIQNIYLKVRPLDSVYQDTVGTRVNPSSIQIKVIDTSVLKVDWYVNGVIKTANGGEIFLRDSISKVAGTYTVRAHIYDECIRHRFSTNSSPHVLDLVRGDTSRLYQDVSWTVQVVKAIRWTSTGSTDANNSANYTPVCVPTSTDTLYLDNGSTVLWKPTDSVKVATVRVASNYNDSINLNGKYIPTLIIYKNLRINSGGIINRYVWGANGKKVTWDAQKLFIFNNADSAQFSGVAGSRDSMVSSHATAKCTLDLPGNRTFTNLYFKNTVIKPPDTLRCPGCKSGGGNY